MRIAFIDIIGIPYDGTTVFKQGLGGSESAVILVSRELAQLGFDVTVFNNCDIDHAVPEIYEGVRYRPLSDLSKDHQFDVVISSRTVIPFTDPKDYHLLNDHRAAQFRHYKLYDRIVSKATMRVLWMHDTFCLGDNLIEDLAVNNRITDIFTLSDFHATYVTNCNHGRRRNFEVLKSKLFLTRNGVHLHKDWVDVTQKDRDLFVYNASVTKGMIPLVKNIWPHVKRHIPSAKLKIIGGYYRFSTSAEPDQQEKDWRSMASDPALAALDIEFTGVIAQKEIADILADASMMIYPSAFPETFGISSLESLCYNTPIVTCRFGALEEVAIEGACYLIDYAIEPNGLFPDISIPKQTEQFVKTVVEAYRNPYLHQQKQNYCNIVKDIAGWNSVALQWKQHFYKKTNRYLPKDEYQAVTKINHRVHKVFGRRIHNTADLAAWRPSSEQPIKIITPVYNAEKYIANCIESVASQDYNNYHLYVIDDASTDNTYQVAAQYQSSNVTVIRNSENRGAVRNQIETIRAYCDSDDIVMLLDGDDSLVNDNTIFTYYNSIYDGSTEFTYGSCWSMIDNIPLISQPYPNEIKQTKSYRQHHFNWILPYTHFRTFKKHLLDNIEDSAFKDVDGNWFKAGGDGSVFYSLIEQSDPSRIKCLQDIVYNYNDVNPLNDYKVNSQQQTATAREIIKMPVQKKRILIAIPTARNIEPQTFKSIYDLVIPDGYETTFQYFYGYNVDQVRNLIADWSVKGFDYLFAVDSDISFPNDTLAKLLAHDKDVVSGLYIQRKPGQHILEVYEHAGNGGVVNIPYDRLKGQGLVEIASCGFGCVLIKSAVFASIGYPQFTYHSAIDHVHTVSEDIDFCKKALAKGFKVWADTEILCEHTGSYTFRVETSVPLKPPVDTTTRLRQLSQQQLLPKEHIDYLTTLKDSGFSPKVIYDIGACVLHWTSQAEIVWPAAEIVAFEAMPECEFLFKEKGIQYHIGVLSNTTGKTVDFYQNTMNPGGNSYYKENAEFNPAAAQYFNESHKRTTTTVTLDAVVNLKKLSRPDLIKMDVQGAELDVLKGAVDVLATTNHVILELQAVEYNTGAPLSDIVIDYMSSIGFDCKGIFCNNGPDGDYYFVRNM